MKIVYIKFIVTHKEHDKTNEEEISGLKKTIIEYYLNSLVGERFVSFLKR